MKYKSTLIAVRDIGRAKEFYRQVLGLAVIADFGANVTLSGGISLQTLDTWSKLIGRREEEIGLGSCCGELYFEEDDIEGFAKKLESFGDVRYAYPMSEQPWGQRAVRFYDPDGHLVEVGESLAVVARRFISGGLSPKEAAVRMDVPLDFIQSLL